MPAAGVGEAVQRTREAAFEFARAKMLAEERAFEEALAAYRRALELDSSDPYSRIEVARFHSHLSQISRSAGQRLEHLHSAAGYASEAHRMGPENLEILHNYAQIHLRLGEHQLAALDQALEAYEELRGLTEGDLQVLTSLGQIYLRKQMGEQAVEVLEEAASYRPGHRMIQAMLLEALMRVGRSLEAEKVLEQLIEIEPTSLEYRLSLAELRSERGDHRAAAAVLSSMGGDLPDNPRVMQFLAQELHLSGANEEALALTGSRSPYSPAMGRLRIAILSSLTRYHEAITELEPLLAAEQDKDRVIQGAMHLSRLLERVGRMGDAATVLRRYVDDSDSAGRLRLKLALIGVLERQEKAEEAIDILSREIGDADEHLPLLGRALSELLTRMDRAGDALVVLDDAIARLIDGGRSEAAESLALRRLAMLAAAEDWPRLTRQAPTLFEASSREVRSAAQVLYADALAGQGRVDDALEVLSAEANEIDPRSRISRQAELLHQTGRTAEAEELLDKVIESGEHDDLFLVAQVYQRLELFSNSIPMLERLLTEQDESPRVLFLLGAGYERSGEHEKAVTIFKQLLEMAPDHAPTLNYLGYLWADLGENLPEAVSLILRAVALAPDNGAYVDSLGWAYFQLGRFQEARGHLEWAARLVPDDATILEHLGDLYVALEDVDRARASYQGALDIEGSAPEAEGVDELRRKLKTLDQEDL